MREYKTVNESTTLEDIGLSSTYRRMLKKYSPSDVVAAACEGRLTDFRGITKNIAESIIKQLDAAGYLPERISRSLALRRLFISTGIFLEGTFDNLGKNVEFTETQRIFMCDCLLTFILDADEKEVLLLRNGLADGKTWTLEAVGSELDFSSDHVHQLEDKALDKLREALRSNTALWRIAFPEIVRAEEQTDEYKRREEAKKRGVALDEEFCKWAAEHEDIMNEPIEDLDLSVRSFNCLKRAGKNTIGDLLQMKEGDFMKVRNLGRNSTEEIISRLAMRGLKIRETLTY